MISVKNYSVYQKTIYYFLYSSPSFRLSYCFISIVNNTIIGVSVISSFIFKSIPKIIFGSGVRTQIAANSAQFGSKTLLVTGGSSFQESAYYDGIISQFQYFNVDVDFAHISKEPSPSAVNRIVNTNRQEAISSVVAIGGGSVLDAGKAISAMLTEDGSVEDYLEGVGSKAPSGSKLPFLAVPTTSGTGSETTANAVLSIVGDKGYKKSLRHDNYIPDVAIIDPELTRSCPPPLTGSCGMDCFTQLVEAFLSTNSSQLTDGFALQGIEAINRSLQLAYKEGDNIQARSDLSYATMLSGIVLANAGLGTVHGFASAVGGILPIPHGVVCGTLMAPTNQLTLKRLREQDGDNIALNKYSQLGKIFSEKQNKNDHWYQDHFIETLAKLSHDLDIPDFSAYTISDKNIEEIISATGNKYNPAQLDNNDLESIFRSRC